MFHDIRPQVRWSSVDQALARMKGFRYEVLPVMPKESDFVTVIMAETTQTSSMVPTWEPPR